MSEYSALPLVIISLDNCMLTVQHQFKNEIESNISLI